MSKKKISFIIGALTAGGAERVVSTLSNKLLEAYEVHIIVLTKSTPFYSLNKNIKLFNCREQFQPSSNIYHAIKSNISLYKTISSYLKEKKIDLVIGFITSANILAILAARKNKIPCIISERNFPKKSNTGTQWRILRKLLYKKADFLVVQTDEIKKHFESIININKIVILNNPIAPELSDARDNNLKKENIVLNIGRLTEQKAQDLLIKSFANINNDNWKLLIIGKGNKQEEYKALIRDNNLEDKVELLEQTKDIAHYYNKSKIFAFTSIFEGFPNALTEAMHFGLPCVSTDCPTGPSKLINHNLNGYLIPMGDQDQLQIYLTKLMENEDLCKKLGTKAMESVKPYMAESVTQSWIYLFEKLLS